MPPIASPYKVVLSFVFILKLVSSYKQFMQISDNKEYLQDASESTFTFIYQKFYNSRLLNKRRSQLNIQDEEKSPQIIKDR